jgi:hypothetical protein
MYSHFFSLKERISNKHQLPLDSFENNGNNNNIEEFNKFIKKTYFICHPTYEKEKYEYLTKFTKDYMYECKYEICCPTWGDKLKQSEISKFAQISKMTRPVISLVYNYIYIMKEIANTNPNDEDHFMILESDSLIVKDFIRVCAEIHNTILKNKFEYDYIDIGNGMGYFPQRFEEYSTIDESKYSLYLTNKMRCTGGIIYKFSFINSVLEYFEKTNNIMYAIDELYDCLVREKKIKIYWLHPSIVIQGSQTGMTESTIQSKDVIWDTTNYDLVSYTDSKSNPKAEIEWEINDTESIKLEMDSNMITDVISKKETIIQLENKHVSELKLTPKYITTDKKVFIDVNCVLFNDSIELSV